MRRVTRLLLATSILGCLSCKAVRSPQSDLKDLIVTSVEGSRRVYYVEDKLVKTAKCPAQTLDTRSAAELSDYRKLCQEEISQGVSLEQFRKNMVEAFQKTYRAERLSGLEITVLDELIAKIKSSDISHTQEADPSRLNPDYMSGIWAQFMPFAAGLKPAPFPPDADRTAVSGLVAAELDLNIPAEGGEFEFPAIAFAEPVNLFGLFANKQGEEMNCPATLRILSVTQMEGDTPVPVFGGEVVGGSRFLLAKNTQKVSSIRVSLKPFSPQDIAAEGLRCKLVLTSQTCDPIILGYKVHIPDPVKMDKRDLKMAEIMALPEVRAWHFLWHGIRNSWPRMNETAREDIRKKLGPEWDAEKGGRGDPTQKGEEFLHMHHVMLGALRQHLGTEMYTAWTEPPRPDDPNFPAPLASDPDMKAFIWGRYNQLMAWHKEAIDPKFVKSLSLSRYGEWLESNLHNTMHTTWAHPTQWYTSYNPGFQEIMSNPGKYPAFAHFSNNSLAGTFTSHVNPFFYRLHGYIEDRIQTWLKVHGYQTIADDCSGKTQCYQWKRNWDGKLPDVVANLAHQHGIDPAKLKELEPETYRTIAFHSQMTPGQ